MEVFPSKAAVWSRQAGNTVSCSAALCCAGLRTSGRLFGSLQEPQPILLSKSCSQTPHTPTQVFQAPPTGKMGHFFFFLGLSPLVDVQQGWGAGNGCWLDFRMCSMTPPHSKTLLNSQNPTKAFTRWHLVIPFYHEKVNQKYDYGSTNSVTKDTHS